MALATRNRRDDGMSADVVAHYLSQIGRYELLTAEEEVRLAQAIEAGRRAAERLEKSQVDGAERSRLHRLVRAGERARTEFLNANLRLVVSQARRYRSQQGIDFIDLIQEGNLGLMRAVDKFDWRKGFKFSTYATWWIRQAISRALAEKSRTLRIPGHLHEKVITLNTTQSRFQAETGRDPSPAELAEESGLDLSEVEEALTVADAVSLEQPVGDDGAMLSDFVEGYGEDDPVVIAEDAAVSDDLIEAVRRLGGREQRIIFLRYGFLDGLTRTHEEIGKEFGLTPERIRQLEKQALTRLRHPSFGLRESDLI